MLIVSIGAIDMAFDPGGLSICPTTNELTFETLDPMKFIASVPALLIFCTCTTDEEKSSTPFELVRSLTISLTLEKVEPFTSMMLVSVPEMMLLITTAPVLAVILLTMISSTFDITIPEKSICPEVASIRST